MDRNHRIIWTTTAVDKMKMISPQKTTQSLKTEPRIKSTRVEVASRKRQTYQNEAKN